ncbi:hypothetical protein SAMN04487897_12442 [Paenibacillus sp. yr247]|uniref:hypothetical protein n=1 Tax=Paenibacillus sp. yr247 TaxID=1761880 RepID=UPI0008861549|nr:hypothetical protein [Paenibacillus sp. yr247]SDO84750.1 hypothetical protein SAMN04487897_12442 [Paenibacillus sp. yr247]
MTILLPMYLGLRQLSSRDATNLIQALPQRNQETCSDIAYLNVDIPSFTLTYKGGQYGVRFSDFCSALPSLFYAGTKYQLQDSYKV